MPKKPDKPNRMTEVGSVVKVPNQAFYLHIRRYYERQPPNDETLFNPYYEVWVMFREGPARSGVLHGTVLATKAEKLVKALGLPVVWENIELPF